MSNALTIIEPGSVVRVGVDYEIAAVVTQVSVRKHGIQYECAWWDGNSRHTAWMSDCEISASDAEKIPIGFRNGT